MNSCHRLSRGALCVVLIVVLFFVSGCGDQKAKTALSPQNPVTITIWNYYNGDQLAAFEQLLADFNSTVGTQKGIVAVNVSQGNIDTLANALIESAEGKAGAQAKPVLAAVYSETAFILDNLGALEPLDAFFTADELQAYVTGFLDEGRFNAKNELLLFPILKSTELFSANETDWRPFAEATGILLPDVTTKEALTAAAAAYYEWTDAQTPDIAHDGKALYGRDSVANYVYIGCYQLGHELFKVKDGKLTVDMDRDTFKALWDNYYIPFIKGHFGAYAKFRSEDCKMGRILALTSSSSSAGYLPVSVTVEDDTTHEISTYFSRDLPFSDAKTDAIVQQGASYCMLKGTAAEHEGAVEFLKWFTQPERNLSFALMSGYSPVTLASNTAEKITSTYTGDTMSAKGKNVLNSLLIGAHAFGGAEAYATKPFEGGKEAREILGNALSSIAAADRAAVTEALAGGATLEEATAPYITDAYFDAWFDALKGSVNEVITH